MYQAILGGLLCGLSVRQTCSSGIFLSEGIQQPIVGLRNLVNDLSMRVVECEVSCEECCSCRRDSASPRAEI